MIGRRRFLEAVSLGLFAASLARAQDPKPKSRTKGKAKAKNTEKAADKPPEVEPKRGPLEPDEQINRILSEARTDGRRLPGIIGAILKGEEISRIGAVGIRKIGSSEPLQFGDSMHLGSCTKAMTATMIGTLVDEGKLRWDSTVGEVFPDWVGMARPEYVSVTLNQLLSHKSGLPHDVPWWQNGQSASVVEQRRGLISRALQVPPETKPGETYAYSNVGFVLAGMMAEEVTRTPWEDLMRRRLFAPLGMRSAGFGAPGTRGKIDHAWGHRATGDLVEAVHEDNPPSMGPAGTVHCSVVDWARFASFHIRGSLGGVRLLKPETLKVLHTPKAGEEYAGGWFVLDRSWAGGMALNHNGSNTLWYCTIWLAPAKDFGFLTATNAGGKPAEEACDQVVKGLLKVATRDEADRQR